MTDGNTPLPKPAHGDDPRPSISALIEIAARLIALLGRETALLREMKIREIASLQQEKLALSRAYEARVRSLNEHGEAIRQVEQAIRDELRATVSRFEHAAEANTIAVQAAQQVNQRLMQAIVDAVNERRGRGETYGADGHRLGADMRPREGVALTFDERL